MTDLLLIAPSLWGIGDLLRPLPEGVTMLDVGSVDELPPGDLDAEVLIAMPIALRPGIIERMPNLRWIQALSAGVDAFASLGVPDHVVMTTARGAHVPQMAELVLTMMLSLVNDLPSLIDAQRAKRWHPRQRGTLSKRHVAILGVGAIGRGVATRCKAFDMRVTGLSSVVTEAEGFDEIRPVEALAEVAAEADHLVILTPYSERTHEIVSAEVIAAMKPDAFLINAARGKVVDEAALIDALAARRIGGAGLDVFATEPLPPESPLWSMDNVLATPHMGGWSVDFPVQVAPIVRENLARWFGDPKRELINPAY